MSDRHSILSFCCNDVRSTVISSNSSYGRSASSSPLSIPSQDDKPEFVLTPDNMSLHNIRLYNISRMTKVSFGNHIYDK